MENEELSLYKSRGYSKCIRDGYRLFSRNFMSIVRHTWLPVLIYSIINGIAVAVLYAGGSIQQQGILTNNLSMVRLGSIYLTAAILGYVLSLVVSMIACGRYYSMLCVHSSNDAFPGKKEKLDKSLVRSCVRRMWTWMIFSFVISFLLVLLILLPIYTMHNGMTFDPSNWLPVLLSFCLMIVMGIITLPLLNVFTSFLIDHSKGFLKTLRTTYGKSFRHWGYLFALTLIVGILYCFVLLILNTPNLILFLADNIDAMGVAGGDPSGLPAYFSIYVAVVMIITLLLTFYFIFFLVTIYYYSYGSIEKQEEEKKERLKDR